MGISLLAEPILTLLFYNNPKEISVAVGLLRPLGAAAVFVAMSGTINSMLQAVGRIFKPVKYMFIGGAIKLILNNILVSRPEINIHGAPWGTFACYLFIMLAGLTALSRETDISINLFGLAGRPLLASLACCASAKYSIAYLAIAFGDRGAIIISVALGAVVYLFFIFLLKAFEQEDLLLLPKGSKFAKILENAVRVR